MQSDRGNGCLFHCTHFRHCTHFCPVEVSVRRNVQHKLLLIRHMTRASITAITAASATDLKLGVSRERACIGVGCSLMAHATLEHAINK